MPNEMIEFVWFWHRIRYCEILRLNSGIPLDFRCAFQIVGFLHEIASVYKRDNPISTYTFITYLLSSVFKILRVCLLRSVLDLNICNINKHTHTHTICRQYSLAFIFIDVIYEMRFITLSKSKAELGCKSVCLYACLFQ